MIEIWHRLKCRMREPFVMRRYRRGEISYGKAAALIGISRWEMSDVLQRHGLFLNVTLEDQLEGMEERVGRLEGRVDGRG